MSTNFVDAGLAPEPPDGLFASMRPDAPPAEEGIDLALLRELFSSDRFIPIMDRSWYDFIGETGRIPLATDTPAAYLYYGWMLWSVWIASYHPDTPDRWPYFFATLEAGQLLDEPIPQIAFGARTNEKQAVLASLRKIIDKLGRNFGHGERALNAFIDWLAFALGADKTRPDYIDADTNLWLYQTFDVTQWLLYPNDYLGDLLEEYRGQGKKNSGFFLTNHVVATFMAEVLYDNSTDHRHELFVEPAIGTGKLMLAASNRTLRLFGCDIDPICAKAARINAALYCPTAVWPLPESWYPEDSRLILTTECLPPAPTFETPAIIEGNALDPETFGRFPSPAPDDYEARLAHSGVPPETARKHALRNTGQGLLFE